ncbi:MAG: NAD(P)H-quinone oxidoreductase subunit O, partial [Elainellaceae cyanobacterium]
LLSDSLWHAMLKVVLKLEANYSRRVMAVKKGDLVRVIREKLENSIEAQASDSRFPPYIFETKGEIVDSRGDYMLVKFGHVPTPNIWLKADQLESFA